MNYTSPDKKKTCFTMEYDDVRFLIVDELYTVEPHFWNKLFLSFVERLSTFEGDFYKMHFRLVLCWEVCPLLDCPLSLYSPGYNNLFPFV